jgi:hypothetical protein
MTGAEIMFVYNADSDWFSSLTGFAHKILSPSTYQCHLCSLTFGKFSIKHEWQSFLETLPASIVFLHKNEFLKQYKIETGLPVIFIKRNKTVNILISKDEIESCKSIGDLKDLILLKLSKDDQHCHSHF